MKKKPSAKQIILAQFGGDEAAFYAQYPTQEAFEMACGGALPHAQNGWANLAPASSYSQTPVPAPVTPTFAPGTPGYYANAPWTSMNQQAAANTAQRAKLDKESKELLWNIVDPRNYGMTPAQGEEKVAMKLGLPLLKDIAKHYTKHKGIEALSEYLSKPESATIKANVTELRRGGTVFPQIQSADGFFSMGYENVPAPYQNGSFQKGGQNNGNTGVAPPNTSNWVRPKLKPNDPQYLTKLARRQNPPVSMEQDFKDFINPTNWWGPGGGSSAAAIAPGVRKFLKSEGFIEDLIKQRDKLQRVIESQETDDIASEIARDRIEDMIRKAQDSRPNYQNQESFPKKNNWDLDFALGGYAGFGEGHPFPYQPRMPKNGDEAYGRPTYGSKWIAQDGMTVPPVPVGRNTTGDPSMQQFQAPGYNAEVGFMDPSYSGATVTPRGQVKPVTPKPVVPRGKPSFNQYSVPGYGYQGSASNYSGPRVSFKDGGPSEFNQGTEFFTTKLNKFTEHLRNTALSATEQEMQNQFMAHGGAPEMFPYAMPYQYKSGGWIQKATASIKRRGTKGVCTGAKFGSPSCPAGSRRYNLAKTFKKMAKKQDGGEGQGMDPSNMTPEDWQQYVMSEEGQQLAQQMGMDPDSFIQAYPTAQDYMAEQENADQGMMEQEGPTEDNQEGGNEENMSPYMQYGGTDVAPDAYGNIDMYTNAYMASKQNSPISALNDFSGAMGNLLSGHMQMAQAQREQAEAQAKQVQKPVTNPAIPDSKMGKLNFANTMPTRAYGGALPMAQDGINYQAMPEPVSSYGTTPGPEMAMAAPPQEGGFNLMDYISDLFTSGDTTTTPAPKKAYIPKSVKKKTSTFPGIDKLIEDFSSTPEDDQATKLAKSKALVAKLNEEYPIVKNWVPGAPIGFSGLGIDNEYVKNAYMTANQYENKVKQDQRAKYLKVIAAKKAALQKLKDKAEFPSEADAFTKMIEGLDSEYKNVEKTEGKLEYPSVPLSTRKVARPAPAPVPATTAKPGAKPAAPQIVGYRTGEFGQAIPVYKEYGNGGAADQDNSEGGDFYHQAAPPVVYTTADAQQASLGQFPGPYRNQPAPVAAPVAQTPNYTWADGTTGPKPLSTDVANAAKKSKDKITKESKNSKPKVAETLPGKDETTTPATSTVANEPWRVFKTEQEYKDYLKAHPEAIEAANTAATQGQGNGYGNVFGYGYPYKQKTKWNVHGNVYNYPGPGGGGPNPSLFPPGTSLDQMKKAYADMGYKFDYSQKNGLLGRILGLPPRVIKTHLETMARQAAQGTPPTLPPAGKLNDRPQYQGVFGESGIPYANDEQFPTVTSEWYDKYYGADDPNAPIPTDPNAPVDLERMKKIKEYRDSQLTTKKKKYGGIQYAQLGSAGPQKDAFGNNTPQAPVFGQAPRKDPFKSNVWNPGNSNMGTDLALGNPQGTSSALNASVDPTQPRSVSPANVNRDDWFKRGKPFGEETTIAEIGALNFGSSIAGAKDTRRKEKDLQRQFKAENMFASNNRRDFGDYDPNTGRFREDQQNDGNMITRYGGYMQDGGYPSHPGFPPIDPNYNDQSQYTQGNQMQISNDDVAKYVKMMMNPSNRGFSAGMPSVDSLTQPDRWRVDQATQRAKAQYQIGGQYDLSDEEIQKLKDGGYDFEYID